HSALENRVLATLSMPTYASVLSGRWMRDAESVAADQLPARDSWMLLRGIWDTALCQTERNGILFGQDGRLFEACDTLDSTQALASVAALDALARQTGLDTTLMIVPLSSAVYPDALPAFYTAADSRALISSLLSSAQDLRTVDVLESLQALPSSTPAYYRTDHHWTADGALAAAQALARAWGLPAITPGTRQSHPGFYGSYYARAPSPFIAPDTLTFDDHPRLRLWIDGEEKFDLFDPVQLQSRDRYAALLWGNHGRLTCVSDAPDGTLLVVHDSYANAFLPYLTQIF
ncbi:MAG: DHHW family protein, partial [Clostridia bacterium]